jgi:hypothetical protein
MPIYTKKTPGGNKMYKWGKSGKWHRTRKAAARQASAAYASGYRKKR